MDSERYVSYSMSDLYPVWQEQAHCAGVGHDYYFGNEHTQPTMSIKQVRNAAKLCDVCPVFDECLRHALTVREEYGVWAGTSGRTRRRLFAMLDHGEADIDQIVEVVVNGRGTAAVPLRSQHPIRGGLRDEDAGSVAL
jgi:WhiB family redox-sensing transcriptional regulator